MTKIERPFNITIKTRAGVVVQSFGFRARKVSGIRFETLYPGGRYGQAQFFIPRKHPSRAWEVKSGYSVQILAGTVCVYEGQIIGIESILVDTPGAIITARGYYQQLMATRTLDKTWADDRLTANAWEWDTTTSGAEKATSDRLERLRITPKAVQWAASEVATLRYTAPTGQTVKRFVCSYDHANGAADWRLQVTATSAGDILDIDADTTSTVDTSAFTASQTIDFDFINDSGGNQTGVNDGTEYSELSGLMVYTETGKIDLVEVAKDLIAVSSEISSYEGLLDPDSDSDLTLAPFATQASEFLADTLERACELGDTSFNNWAYGMLSRNQSNDNLPVLFVEKFPALTDWEYEVKQEETPGTSVYIDADMIRNWITVTYKNTVGIQKTLTPDDDASLKDTTSITINGQRDHPMVLSGDSYTATEAKNIAQVALAALRYPTVRTQGGVSITGTIRRKQGTKTAVSSVYAGQRVKLIGFSEELTTAGPVFLITKTDYDQESDTVTMQLDKPMGFTTFFVQQDYRRS